MKIVINKCFGGFSLSKKAYEFLGWKWDGYGYNKLDTDSNHNCDNSYDAWRADHRLVKCIETLGDDADGEFASLSVVEIPDDVRWSIANHDGIETIEEVHRTWW